MRNAIDCVSHKELNCFISHTITRNLETKTDRKLKLVLSFKVTAKNERSVQRTYTVSQHKLCNCAKSEFCHEIFGEF